MESGKRETMRSATQDERGQTLVEYALIVAVVSLGAILALGFLSGKINSLFSKAGNSLNAVEVAAPPPGSTSTGVGPPPPGPVPSGGGVNINCPSTCDDGDILAATTFGWSNGPIITYSFTWQTSEFYNASGSDSCDPTEANYGNSQGPTSQAATTSNYTTPSQPSGTTADSIRVIVTATNANGTSTTSVGDCVVVYN
jgi:Flp pilus assembly pilin Flp